jgi:hypothetical protein
MPQTKRTAQRKRRSKVVLALGAAGLSLSLASSASAAVGGMNGAGSAPVSKQVYEEEISDVSLATSTSSTGRGGAHGWPWAAVVAIVAVPVGAICTISTRHRRSATQSIRRRLGRSAGRTNINLTAPRASQCSTELGGLYDAARSNGAHSSWRNLKPRRDGTNLAARESSASSPMWRRRHNVRKDQRRLQSLAR